jgi:phenylpropionate dioxygenase-like ring-hydroxylating dioxygenase large terminal subunit
LTWVPVCPAAEVPPGAVRPTDIGDLELVVWRDHLGRPAAMDARCPHLWSHLGVEGVVDGAEIVCTAHFWRFDRDGRGTKVAVTGRRDEKADIRTFAVREDGGQLLVDVP